MERPASMILLALLNAVVAALISTIPFGSPPPQQQPQPGLTGDAVGHQFSVGRQPTPPQPVG